MDKEGPSAGNPRKVGLILASRNGVSLDIAATRMIGFNPRKIYMIKEAVKRKLADYNVEIMGENPGKIEFRKPTSSQIGKTRKMLKRLFKEREITVDRVRCERCGLCMRHCPGRAISMPFYPEVDKKKCIRCFCCIEICPNHALSLKS
jgi:ferredoxin